MVVRQETTGAAAHAVAVDQPLLVGQPDASPDQRQKTEVCTTRRDRTGPGFFLGGAQNRPLGRACALRLR